MRLQRLLKARNGQNVGSVSQMPVCVCVCVCGCDYVIQVALIDYCIIMSLSKILDAWVFIGNVYTCAYLHSS